MQPGFEHFIDSDESVQFEVVLLIQHFWHVRSKNWVLLISTASWLSKISVDKIRTYERAKIDHRNPEKILKIFQNSSIIPLASNYGISMLF